MCCRMSEMKEYLVKEPEGGDYKGSESGKGVVQGDFYRK